MNLLSLYEELAKRAYAGGSPLNGLWWDIPYVYQRYFSENEVSFPSRIEVFLEVIRILLSDGRLFLGKNGELLGSGIDDQIEKFCSSFPSSEPSVDENGGMSVWFFLDDCPAEAVWVYRLEDGSQHLEWT